MRGQVVASDFRNMKLNINEGYQDQDFVQIQAVQQPSISTMTVFGDVSSNQISKMADVNRSP